MHKCDLALASKAMEIQTHSDFQNTNNSNDYWRRRLSFKQNKRLDLDLLTSSQVGSISSHLIFSLCFKHIAMIDKKLKEENQKDIAELPSKGTILLTPKYTEIHENQWMRLQQQACWTPLWRQAAGAWHSAPVAYWGLKLPYPRGETKARLINWK